MEKNMAKPVQQRLWEIDAIRGTALLLMIAYHLLYDLKEFYNVNIAYNQGLYFIIGKTAAILFILIAGVSSTFSKKNTRRAFKLIAWGYVIYIVMYLVVPGSNIVFGILQFLGVCLLLYPVFNNFSPYWLAAIGTIIILAGDAASQLPVSHNWLAPLGLMGPDFYSVDYFPLIPWFGVFLWGISIRKLVYKQNSSLFATANRFLKPVAAVGKHTLIIYLIHQPLIMAALYVIFHHI
ncbi:Uncharacterized membrane protein [Desulfotomaculum arcticum]|uniref:Uncharacterized membrane protein n=1 Tax=Desulfotruncus arcticus DSM 17038 TaxID=1121424 RepID=A0A1I2P9A6_9FIRM|nr:heparan-alpha-glucosaminide N-acetyltransferase [Desulfotruncus arcticus]SFG12752.1 Uncharacterized membrane protein [Desulfotomaculum arcticum] [Desulfotruncus arcticus DSM 17038]